MATNPPEVLGDRGHRKQTTASKRYRPFHTRQWRRAGVKVDFKREPSPQRGLFFREDNIIVELKTLEENSFGEGYKRKLERLVAKWYQTGQVLTFGTSTIESQAIDANCQHEWFDLLSKPLQTNLVAKANVQIGTTKDLIDAPNAKGILMMASDGNEDLEPRNVWHLFCRILEKRHPGGNLQFSNIDGIIYFTPRMQVYDVLTGALSSLWLSGPRTANDPGLMPFLTKLAGAWPTYLASISDVPIVRGDLPPVLENIRFAENTRPVPKIEFPDV